MIRELHQYDITCDGLIPGTDAKCSSRNLLMALNLDDLREKLRAKQWRVSGPTTLCPGTHAPLETVTPQEES